MLEKLKEFKETFSERIRSPFIGSLIITWSLIHWKIYALILYAQKDITITERIDGIEKYMSSKCFYGLVVCPILITLVILLVYNVLNAVGLTIKLLYDNWASPFIQEKLYNKNIIEKPKYEKLKREYSTLRNEYEKEKENFINTENQSRNLIERFETFKKGSFEANLTDDITHAFNANIQWENSYTLPNGTTGLEIFTCEKNSFNISNGKKFRIENIRLTPNGKILSFDKIIDNIAHPNYLIRDGELNYYGIEDKNTKIIYRKKQTKRIIIDSAIYKSDENYITVTPIIQRLVDNNIFEFTVSNELMSGDPGRGKPKTIDIQYTIDGASPTSLSGHENSTLKIE